jgi:hypothetical protein
LEARGVPFIFLDCGVFGVLGVFGVPGVLGVLGKSVPLLFGVWNPNI